MKHYISEEAQTGHKLLCCQFPNGLGICGCTCHVKSVCSKHELLVCSECQKKDSWTFPGAGTVVGSPESPNPTSHSIEGLKKKYTEMWNNGEFEWNHHEGDGGGKQISLERVWQTFVEPSLTTVAQEAECRHYKVAEAQGVTHIHPTPDTEWEKEEWGAWKFVSEMLDNPDEHGIYPTSKCYKQIYDFVVAQKEKAISSRDTYWRERVEEAVKELLSYLPDATGRYAYAWEECDGEEQEMVKAIRAKYTPITNEDNLK